MKIFKRVTCCIIMTGTILSSLSCDGIYDDPSEMPVESKPFQYVDATSYTKWVYFYLDKNTFETYDYNDSTGMSDGWAFAMHRYDCKTNGGSAYETQYTSLDDLSAALSAGTFSLPTDDQFTADKADSIIIDMSTMMQGYLGYAKSEKNSVLGRWLDVNTSQMPPIYTPSNKVYLVRLKDSSVAAILFTAFSNPYIYDTKGYISFDYIYPVNTTK